MLLLLLLLLAVAAFVHVPVESFDSRVVVNGSKKKLGVFRV